MLRVLQDALQSADGASQAMFDEIFGCGAQSHVIASEEPVPGPCEDFVDLGEGKKHDGQKPQHGAVTKGIDENMLDATVRKGIVVELRQRPCLQLSGRQLVFQNDDMNLDLEPQKRVICGVCYKSNLVPARACIIDCGACGARNLAGDETGVRVKCFSCGISNLAEPGIGCISCSACKTLIAVPDEE